MASRDGPRPPRQRRESNEPSIYADDLLHSLNSNNTVADLILNDDSARKRYSLEKISHHSGIAKTILDAIEDDDSFQLGTITSINALKLMSDIYDNKIVIFNQ
nr:p12 [Mamestra configurata nucleopolyhedrovirus A]WRQ96489.1 p12 [Mamestra configurata nucleopolyhedrovirus A]WRQ96809.1 p12 [Mamestra configurata nucleopolyhedrovirus B]WRQ96972.1 p12 [Mamestra configurata nucleopolyhedrovirus B]